VTSFAHQWKAFGEWSVYELPAQPPTDAPYGDVLWLGCDTDRFYGWGRYALTELAAPFRRELPRSYFPPPRAPVDPKDQKAIDEQTALVSAVALDPHCVKLRPTALDAEFTHVLDRNTMQLWLRKRDKK